MWPDVCVKIDARWGAEAARVAGSGVDNRVAMCNRASAAPRDRLYPGVGGYLCVLECTDVPVGVWLLSRTGIAS